MPQSDHLSRDLEHRLNLLEGFMDREAERLKLFFPLFQRRLDDLRFVIKHRDGRTNLHSLEGPHNNPVHRDDVFLPLQVVRKLKIGECPDSSLWFEIDESGHWFTLQARVTGLLRFLVSDSFADCNGNGLMPLYSRKSLLGYLKATGGGRDYHPSFVYKMVNKLGVSLRLYDSRNLVDSSKNGVRFLVRKNGVEFMKLDRPPLEPILEQPHRRFLQKARRPVVSIREFVMPTDSSASRRSLDSKDRT